MVRALVDHTFVGSSALTPPEAHDQYMGDESSVAGAVSSVEDANGIT